MGTINMLGLAKRVKARILMASTSEIYGDPNVHPQPESYWGNVNTIGPRVSRYIASSISYTYLHLIYTSLHLNFIRPVMMKGSVWLRQ